jgi:hypothetical protein
VVRIRHADQGGSELTEDGNIQPAKLVLIYTPGGAEGMFVEGGDKPQPGVQVQRWG